MKVWQDHKNFYQYIYRSLCFCQWNCYTNWHAQRSTCTIELMKWSFIVCFYKEFEDELADYHEHLTWILIRPTHWHLNGTNFIDERHIEFLVIIYWDENSIISQTYNVICPVVVYSASKRFIFAMFLPSILI